MGKYAATRGFHRDRSRASSGKNSFSGSINYFTEMPKNESQFRVQAFLYGFDPTGIYRGFLTSRDSSAYWNDYFANTGLTWSDIKYPTRMYGFGDSGYAARSALRVSENIAKLY